MPRTTMSPIVPMRSAPDPASHPLLVRDSDSQDRLRANGRVQEWALDRLRLRSGGTVLDVGSGSGTMLPQLAERVAPHGWVTGVEPNEEMRETAIDRLLTDIGGQVEVVDGSPDALPCDDDSVDAIWCERFLQHVAEPLAAFREFFRVLRPGGRVAVLDVDYGTAFFHGVDQDLFRRAMDATIERLPNPYAARAVPDHMAEVGLRLDPDIGASAIIIGPDDLRVPNSGTMLFVRAAEYGVISEEERDRALAEIREQSRRGAAIAVTSLLAFIGRKDG